MNKILLALAILSAGAGAFHTARQSTTQLQHEANVTREAWLAQAQRVAVAQSDQAGLMERVGELKQALAQTLAVAESALWSALQTNRTDHLPPELRERLLEELGFNWRSSPDFVVVSKQTVRDIGMQAILRSKLTDMAATVLALTPEERGQAEAALERVKTDFKDWVLSHAERGEPKDDVVAHYALPKKDPAMSQSISNAFATTVFGALGRERAEVFLTSAQKWKTAIGLYDCDAKPPAMIVKRYLAGNEQRLKVQIMSPHGEGNTHVIDIWSSSRFDLFPRAFRPIFPNGWPDVAQREGFELPAGPQIK